jgi:hypothetical protein
MSEKIAVNDKGGKQTDIGFSVEEYLSDGILRAGKVAYDGQQKYGKGNSNKITFEENINHAVHHLLLALKLRKGEEIPESEKTTDHLAHAICRAAMAMKVEEVEVVR